MDRGELRAELDNRISAAKVSGFWTDAMKNSWLNLAGQRVADFKRWKALELALVTQTRSSKEYYDYPTEEGNAFKKNSIYQIDIEDEEYPDDQSGRKRVNWTQFQKAKQIDDDSVKIFTSHKGSYFLHPVPDDGKEMSIYGLQKWVNLDDDTDVHILGSEFDEAIVKVALATALRKAKKYSEAKAELLEVFDPQVGILQTLWMQEQDEAPQGYGGEAQSSRFN